jgi:hypothetical protein
MSVMVDDQAKALGFYTEVLGFVKKREIPIGEHSWLTVVSPEDLDGTELSLEPDEHPAARTFKRRSSRTASRSRLSPSPTSRPSTTASPSSACTSPSRRRTGEPSPPSSTTRAATSFRSQPRTDRAVRTRPGIESADRVSHRSTASPSRTTRSPRPNHATATRSIRSRGIRTRHRRSGALAGDSGAGAGGAEARRSAGGLMARPSYRDVGTRAGDNPGGVLDPRHPGT